MARQRGAVRHWPEGPRELSLKVVQGVEGPSVYLNDYRIAGNKPWGGGRVLYTFTTTTEDLERALNCFPIVKKVGTEA